MKRTPARYKFSTISRRGIRCVLCSGSTPQAASQRVRSSATSPSSIFPFCETPTILPPARCSCPPPPPIPRSVSPSRSAAFPASSSVRTETSKSPLTAAPQKTRHTSTQRISISATSPTISDGESKFAEETLRSRARFCGDGDLLEAQCNATFASGNGISRRQLDFRSHGKT